MLPQTYELLGDRGFLSNTQIDRTKLGLASNALMLDDPVTVYEEIDTKGRLVVELCHGIFGDIDDGDIEYDLHSILGPLTSPSGACQDLLDNGFVLCSASVTRRLVRPEDEGGTEYNLTRQARFITENEDLIVDHYWAPSRGRIESAIGSFKHRLEVGVARRPQLATRRPAAIGKVHEFVRAELPEVTS